MEFLPWLKVGGDQVGRVLGQKSSQGINPKFDPQLLIEIDLNSHVKEVIHLRDHMGVILHTQKVI